MFLFFIVHYFVSPRFKNVNINDLGFLFAQNMLVLTGVKIIMKNIFSNFFLLYIKFWAKIALTFTKAKIIGVAGSVGKTSTKMAIKVVFEDFGRVVVSEGNSETGVPLGLLGIKQETFSLFGWLATALKCPLRIFYLKKVDYLIVEMGTDDIVWPKNMEYLLSIVRPEYVIWLNTSPAHLQQFGANINERNYEKNLHLSRLSLANEDGKIITKNNFKLAIVNNDDAYIKNVLTGFDHEKINFYGLDKNNSSFLLDYSLEFPNTKFLISVFGEEYALEIKNHLLAKEYWQNFASVLLLAKSLKLNVPDAITALEDRWLLPKGRGGLIKAINNSWIIDGSYNASPDAFEAQLDLFKKVVEKNNFKPVLVVGDMRELGDVIAPQAHQQLAQRISQTNAVVYLVGSLMKTYVLPHLIEQKMTVKWFEDSYQLGKVLKQELLENSLVLFKGSQNTIFLETAVEMVLKNIEDKQLLCRQSKHWEKVRQKYFKMK